MALAVGASRRSSDTASDNINDNNKQQDPSSNNMILIKYANVTSPKEQAGSSESGSEQPADSQNNNLQLNTFRLYEPLTVAVIESKFAHSIQLFDVSHNQLSTLSKDLFCPLSNEVRQLNISRNLLENFDCLGLISQAGQLCLSELRVLDMSHNLVKHLPATGVATLQNLEILDLSHNLIESLDELSLSSLYKLTKLDLSANRIQQLPIRIFHKSNSMQVLKLQSNQLQTNISQQLLSGLISLEELNLSRNRISVVENHAFIDKVNLRRVDLSHNQLATLRHEALNVTSVKQPVGYRPRLFHNGQYAGVAPKQSQSQSVSAEFLLAHNPFICDCQLEWLRKPNSGSNQRQPSSSLSSTSNSQTLEDQARQDQLSAQLIQMSSSNLYQNDQPSVIPASSSDSSNNISEIISNQQVDSITNRPQPIVFPANSKPLPTTLLASSTGSSSVSNSNNPAQQVHHHYARVGDLDLIKCTPLFQRNTQKYHHNHHHYDRQHRASQSSSMAPPDGGQHSQSQHHHQSYNNTLSRQPDTMIDIVSADSSHFLCRYKSHCFALCHCCEFDACDCEMICPNGCNCYYDLTWQTNIIDCSSRNHTTVPDRIPMDVSGLYLDGNNIESLKPSNLIARKSLKALHLNSSNLQYIANRTFNGLIELQTLYLHDNMLRSLNGSEFEPLTQLRALYLQSNRLDHISNQTFIYLRSLEILDLSNNRLTHTNLDLFWFIGHHNIRLRQLSIAHNWWSCQCSSINSFRSILKQKFLLNGSVNIADKNQLRCYYNSTTVGPLILADASSPSGTLQQQPLYASYPATSNRQTQLTEINQCSETIEDHQEVDVNPPLINPVTEIPASTPTNEYPNDPIYNSEISQHPSFPKYPDSQPPLLDSPMYTPGYISNGVSNPSSSGGIPSGQRAFGSSSMPLTSFILLSLLLAVVMIIAFSIFVFIRKQQRYHQSHKKSSAASTTSASSNASSTAISSLNGKSQRHQHLHHHTIQNPHLHHLIMSNGSGGATTTSIGHLQHQSHHLPSALSQSNIYAALVSPTTNNSTTVTNAINGGNNGTSSIINSHLHNNPYSSSSTTASHHSGSSHGASNGFHQHWQSAGQHQSASIYNQPYNMSGMENHYTMNASSISHKTSTLYHPSNCEGSPTLASGQLTPNDWIKLPKVKQFMSKLVNKSLALGGYRSCSRDELSAITSDKIYDAFISYDKRDEAFVLQHLSAELEYGQPQYRIADRFRDLPLPTSNYIAEAITSVIGCSHRTIIVLTENYLASSWCRYELQAALREAAMDKAHKIIAVVLDPKCLLEMDNEMRTLLTNSNVSIYQSKPQQQQQQQQAQLVQLDGTSSSELILQQQQQQLVATLTNHSGGNQQVSTQTTQLATSKIAFINYNDRKFWNKIKQLMPLPRPSTQTLTLTTKN